MSDRIASNRRDFLKGTSLATAGIVLAGGLNLARNAHAAGGDQLKIALIGCGGRGTGAVGNCFDSCENVKLIAVADAFKDRADSAAEALRKQYADKVDVPAERIFVEFDAYKQAIAAGPDVVMIATPPGFRPIHYAAAIQAGKHVFMEKPCCVDAPGYRSLLETNKLADEKNLKVVVGLQRRYDNSYLEEMKKIHDGGIGDLILLRAYWNGTEPWFRPRAAGQTEMEYQMRNWYHFVWLCGDNICEQHVHNLDVCNWAKGKHPVEANAMGACVQRYNTRTKETGKGQIFDEHFIEFSYDDGSKLYSQCRQMPGTWSNVSEAAHGTKGFSICHSAHGGSKPYEQEHVELFKAIRNNEKHNDGWYGADSSFTAVLGRMASYSGQCIKWDEAVEKGPNEMPAKFAFDAEPPVKPDDNGNYPIAIPGTYKAF
jgi:myo-inositol 2-dehydrogenase / D-chiro-inositol 1-dehydrogenase